MIQYTSTVGSIYDRIGVLKTLDQLLQLLFIYLFIVCLCSAVGVVGYLLDLFVFMFVYCREVEDFARRLNSDWPERMQEILSLGQERRAVPKSMNGNGSTQRYTSMLLCLLHDSVVTKEKQYQCAYLPFLFFFSRQTVG